jgi:hypothetical protein
MNAVTIDHASDFEFAFAVIGWGIVIMVCASVLAIVAFVLYRLTAFVIMLISEQIRWQRGRKHAKIIGFKVDVEDYKKRRYGNGKH